MTVDSHYAWFFSLRDATIPKIRQHAGSELWSDYQYNSAVRMFENELAAWANKNGIGHPQLQDAIDSILASVYSIIESDKHRT